MKKLLYILLPVSAVLMISCNKWLDVKPKTQIESELNFSNQQGFKDALTGVYLNMSDVKLYGKDMTFGFVDVLARQYTQLWDDNLEYYQAMEHEYNDQSVINKVISVWTASYFSIANLNNLLDAIGKKDSSYFDPYVYNVIKGEALGLRALHHFDMLRLFSPAPASKPASTLSIPYRYTYGAEIIPQSTVAEVMQKALKDLNEAISLLKISDPLVAGTTVPATTTGYLRNRPYKFNYYAALALKARIHLYAGNMDSARLAAMEVVNSNKFTATTVSAISGGNRLMSTEVIFNVNVSNIETLSADFFNTAIMATKSTAEWNEWFELSNGGSSDYRYLYQTLANGSYRFPVKYDALANTNAAATKRVPLFRLTEMYYIISESYLGTDGPQAVTWLNKARTSRNLATLSTALDKADILREIIKEYQKEFIAEGQLFYLYKRLNLPAIPFYQKTMNDAIYVLPMPDDEITYGLIK